MTATSGKRLHRIDALTETHMGRIVDVNGLQGVLEGVIPVAGRYVLRLRVGGCPAFSDAYDAGTTVEVWRAT